MCYQVPMDTSKRMYQALDATPRTNSPSPLSRKHRLPPSTTHFLPHFKYALGHKHKNNVYATKTGATPVIGQSQNFAPPTNQKKTAAHWSPHMSLRSQFGGTHSMQNAQVIGSSPYAYPPYTANSPTSSPSLPRKVMRRPNPPSWSETNANTL